MVLLCVSSAQAKTVAAVRSLFESVNDVVYAREKSPDVGCRLRVILGTRSDAEL